MACRHADMWWIVPLTSMVFNLSYGPWEGSAWHEKLKGSALELCGKLEPDAPFLEAFLPALCRDKGSQADGTESQRRTLVKQIRNVDGEAAKLPRVATKRWFSWMAGFKKHDRMWHSRLMFLVHLGM